MTKKFDEFNRSNKTINEAKSSGQSTNRKIANFLAHHGMKTSYSKKIAEEWGEKLVEDSIEKVPELKKYIKESKEAVAKILKHPMMALYREYLKCHDELGGGHGWVTFDDVISSFTSRTDESDLHKGRS